MKYGGGDGDGSSLRLRAFLAADDAVSPVIGVILMVAITVILAAVLGTFSLGLYEGGNEAAPSVDFDTEYSGTELTVTHVHGETLDETRLSWVISDTPSPTVGFSGTSRVSPGDEQTLSNIDSDETVRLVWSTAGEERSATIMQWDGPDA